MPGENSGRRGAIARNEYLIDRYRVLYETGTRWQCPCAEFAAFEACRHTREAAGMWNAQEQIRARLVAPRLRSL